MHARFVASLASTHSFIQKSDMIVGILLLLFNIYRIIIPFRMEYIQVILAIIQKANEHENKNSHTHTSLHIHTHTHTYIYCLAFMSDGSQLLSLFTFRLTLLCFSYHRFSFALYHDFSHFYIITSGFWCTIRFVLCYTFTCGNV